MCNFLFVLFLPRIALSRLRHGFKSRWDHQAFQWIRCLGPLLSDGHVVGCEALWKAEPLFTGDWLVEGVQAKS